MHKQEAGAPTIVASVSGGKDSAALTLWLTEQGLAHERVFFDTGWEHAHTYRYLDELRERVGPIQTLTADVPLPTDDTLLCGVLEIEHLLGRRSAFVRLCVHKGVFPARTLRWCTEALKVKLAIAHLASIRGQKINATGVRAAESRARSRLPEWEAERGFGPDVLVWRPLIRWSEQDVIDIHARHDLPPNPLYLRGAERVGCYPCIFARKTEIRRIAEQDPERIEVVRQLEHLVSLVARERAERRGERPRNPPSLFQAPSLRRVDPETGKRDGRCWPIDKVVDWSRTSRGGRQVELFALPPSEAGCMRWGLCDSSGAVGDDDA